MKKIGIIGAMELEVETLKAHMTTTNITTKATMEFHEGTPVSYTHLYRSGLLPE